MQHASEDHKCIQTFSPKTQRKEIIFEDFGTDHHHHQHNNPWWALAFFFGMDGTLNYVI
jgi:hypothetical protein